MLINNTLLQFLYSTENSSAAFIRAAFLLLLNSPYGRLRLQVPFGRQTTSDLASPNFIQNLAIKRRTQNFMVWVLLSYLIGLFAASHVSTLLSLATTNGLDRKQTYNTIISQGPTSYWTSLISEGMNGNGDPLPKQTSLLQNYFDQLDSTDQLNNVTFDSSYVTYTPLLGEEMGEITDVVSGQASFWTNWTDVIFLQSL